MERNITWKSPKIITVFLVSLLLLIGLMVFANFVRTPVEFPDPNLERVVREKIEKRSGTIYKSDLITVTELDASDREIKRLEGMEAFSRLVTLNLANNQVEDLTPLANLNLLRILDLSDNQISNLSKINFQLIKLIPLRVLRLNNSLKQSSIGIKDVTFLSPFINLEVLELKNNHVENLNPLRTLVNLRELKLQGNNISSSITFEHFNNLEILDLSNNQITDLSSFQFHKINNSSLKELFLNDNSIDYGEGLNNISHLSNLENIEVLSLRNNQINDINSLSSLTSLQDLDLRGNKIVSIDSLSNLINLQRLNLRENNITDLTPISGLSNLIYINIHSNPINHGLQTLGNLVNLESLIMRNVTIGESYLFLENLENLHRLNIRNTKIDDVSVIGTLMAAGALQNDPDTGVKATVDLLEINPSNHKGDPYLPLRRFWDNISHRFPLSLPYYPSPVQPPSASHRSGFYKEAFYLLLATEEKDGRIFYTLDGSKPSLNPHLQPIDSTFEYKYPILIQDRTNEKNNIANIITTRDLVYNLPSDDIFKINVIRTITINNEGVRSDVITHTFFVNNNIPDKYSLPIISITTNPNYFFDNETGIYVAGVLYETLDQDKPWWNPANYSQRGLKWERPANIQLFTPDGTQLLNQNAGVRIHGITSRWLPQKSLRLYANEVYDTENFFMHDFFPQLNFRFSNEKVETYQTLILRNSGQDWASTFFRDSMIQSLLTETKLDIQGSYPVVTFLNGEYWGIHNIRSRYDEHYFQTYYGISPYEYSIIDGVTLDVLVGDITDIQHFLDLYELIEIKKFENVRENIYALADDADYEIILSMIDIENFIDYISVQLIINNTDWPWGNIRMWRKTNPSFNPEVPVSYGHDGKWRFLVFDLDLGFVYPETNTITRSLHDIQGPLMHLFRALLTNETFRSQFINRFADLLNTSFQETIINDRIDEYEQQYYPEIEEQIRRWGNLGGTVEGRMNYIRWGSLGASFPHWQRDINNMREFADSRPPIIRQHLIDYLDLSGLVNVTLKTNHSEGYIRINSIDVTENTPGIVNPNQWSGIYFQGVPVKITAIPNEGYQFKEWVSGSHLQFDPETPTLILDLNDDIQLTALFIEYE